MKNLTKKCSMFLALLTVSFLGAANGMAQAGRVKVPVDPVPRCGGLPVTPESCAKRRDYALAQGCITSEEHGALVKFNAYPNCDYSGISGSGLDQFGGYCPCGCFDPDTQIMSLKLNDGLETWTSVTANEIAHNRLAYKVAVPTESKTLSNPQLSASKVVFSTVGEEADKLFVFKTQRGQEIKVTRNHPMILADGTMVPAYRVKMEDEFRLINGDKVALKSIQQVATDKKVVNFTTGEPVENIKGHIVYGNEIAVGDLYLQGVLSDSYNQVEVRR